MDGCRGRGGWGWEERWELPASMSCDLTSDVLQEYHDG